METTTTRRADRLQRVADAIRLMKDAGRWSRNHVEWGNLNLAELDSDRQVDGFNMGRWLAGPTIVEQGPHRGGCSTIGCIAGTTATLFRDKAGDADPRGIGIVEIAGTILGLDKEAGSALFWGPHGWALGDITREQAAVACERTAAGCKPEDIWSHI